jgi:hypothetical protein
MKHAFSTGTTRRDGSRALARRVALGFALATALLALPSPSLANGRFPRAERLIESASSADELTIAATYGLVVTHDRGRSWQQICEPAFALQSGYSGDPLFDLAPGGTMVVSVQSSFNVSPDRGCQWNRTLGGSGEEVIDFTISRSTKTLIAAVATGTGAAHSNGLRVSTDDGLTWAALGAPIPMPTVLTIDVAPSDPSRIYASGLSATNKGVFAVSIDRGAHWATVEIPGTNLDEIPFIAAVHPNDPSKVFVRTDAWKDRDVIDTANDALLVTSDAGKTWKEVIRGGAKLLGFALSPDGASMRIGYGDPVDSSRLVDSASFGIWSGSTADLAVARIYDQAVTCLTWSQSGLYVCTSAEASGGLEVAFAPGGDLGASGASLKPLLRRSDVKGTVECCPGTTAAVCAIEWLTTCETFATCGAEVDAGPRVCGGTNGTPGGADGGASSPDGGDDATATGIAKASCACRSGAARAGSANGANGAGGAIAALVVARRRGRRRS